MYARRRELVDAQEIKEFVLANQPSLEEGTDVVLEEVLAVVTGRRVAEILAGKESEVRTWLQDFFEWFKEKLGLTQYSKAEVAKMNLAEYADAIGVDLTRGEELFKNNEEINRTREGRVSETAEQRRRRRERWDANRGDQTLEGTPKYKNSTGAIPELVSIAEEYAEKNGIDYRRQSKYVEVDKGRAIRIAEAYDKMEHDPQNPVVKEAYVYSTKNENDSINSGSVIEIGGEYYWGYKNDGYACRCVENK